MKRYIKRVMLCFLFITLLYAPTKEASTEDKVKESRAWLEGARGWSENGTNLWTAVAPLPNYNVGIGTATPAHRLDVAGSFNITGDFRNQEIAYNQGGLLLGNPTIIRTVTITTSGPGSAVLLLGSASFTAEDNGWYSLSIHRGGQQLCETNEGTPDVGHDMCLALSWLDEPPAGTHTYELRVGTNGAFGTFYLQSLIAIEIKK